MADDSTMPLDHEAIMAAMQMAERVPEPNGVKERDVVYDGSDSLPTPMMVATVPSAGYARMWDTETGDESRTKMNLSVERSNAVYMLMILREGTSISWGSQYAISQT